MSRMRQLAPRGRQLRPRGQSGSAAPRLRDRVDTWRAWYKTARWQRLRGAVLVRDMFTCRKCGRIEADTSQLVGDHIIQHRGDPDLFWDAGNIQCLCKPCHDRVKQAEERGRV